jgi:ketosteroid isomerase-like protein
LDSPAATLDALTAALRERDLGALASCFCRDARLLTADRTVVSGRKEIALLLAQLIDAESTLELSSPSLLATDHVALLRARCATRTKGPDLFWLSHSTDLTAVLRLVEGDWKLAVLAPWEGEA